VSGNDSSREDGHDNGSEDEETEIVNGWDAEKEVDKLANVNRRRRYESEEWRPM